MAGWEEDHHRNMANHLPVSSRRGWEWTVEDCKALSEVSRQFLIQDQWQHWFTCLEQRRIPHYLTGGEDIKGSKPNLSFGEREQGEKRLWASAELGGHDRSQCLLRVLMKIALIPSIQPMADQLNQGRTSVDFMERSGQPPLGGPKVGRHKDAETGGIQTGNKREGAG